MNITVSSLAKKCRFNGHCQESVSVAEHSIMVYNIMLNEMKIEDPRILPQGPLRDAAGACLWRSPKPIKSCLVGFQDIENKILDV